MSNKLKDIFSNKRIEFKGTIGFKDNESYKKFFEALEIVQNEGHAVKVDGIFSFASEVINGEIEYPFIGESELSETIIEPTINNIKITLDTEYGKKTVLFKYYSTIKEIIFETSDKEIIYFKIIFIKNTSNLTFTYKLQHKFAKTIKDISESYNTAIKLLEKIFDIEKIESSSTNIMSIYEMKNSFLVSEEFFKKLYLVEQELQIFFDPSQIDKTENAERELDELYLLIVEKKVIRINAKLNNPESILTPIESKASKLEIGTKLYMTFLGDLKYIICGQKILIYTANLISNAIIKEIKEENDTIKVLYDDTDSQPMYISYTGFKTNDEAKQERDNIITHKEKYENALTINEYLKKIKV